MLAFNFFAHHVEGGREYMLPLTFLLLLDLGLAAYMIFRKKFSPDLMETFKHIGFLILGYGIFGTLSGFVQIFDALEHMPENISQQVLSGGVKVSLLNVLYGTAYFCIVHAIYVVLKISNLRRSQ